MSILSTVVGAITGNPPPAAAGTTPAAVAARLQPIRERLADLQRQHSDAALRWAETGDAADRDRLAAEIIATKADISALEAAFAAAGEREAAEGRRQSSALRASRVHSATMHLRAAERAADDLATALKAAGEARHKLLKASAKARVSAPDPLPPGSLTEHGVLDRLMANEMHRLTHDRKLGALPGSKPASIMVKDDPGSQVPLAAQLREAHDHAIVALRGDAVGDVPSTIARGGIPSDYATTGHQPSAANDDIAREPVMGGAALPRVEEAPEVDEASLLPGTRTAEEIMATVPRVKMS
ncbi:MAG TPA: hypothetical protein VKY24_03470 [Reyranella sp.]|nr:hypothetical protein [Reyranella sp.]